MCGRVSYQGIWKRQISISASSIFCEGLPEGVAVVVKCKKSKITWIIMNALGFSTMYTIMDAFSGIRSKVEIVCAQ